jgi:segregation and condensation protein B
MSAVAKSTQNRPRKTGRGSRRPPEPEETTSVSEPVSEPAPAQTVLEEPSSTEEISEVGERGAHATSTAGTSAPGDDAPAGELDRATQLRVLESLVFVSERIVTAAQLARVIKSRAAIVRELMSELMQTYDGRGIEIVEVAGGYQFRSAPSSADFVRDFVAQRPVRLTRAQLETLALCAYRQPITRAEIDEVRGVDSGSAMHILLERGLLKMLGRKDEPGRPLLYGTSPAFLEFFGMKSLKDLPTLREFTELSDENRALFKRKTGEAVEDAEAELLAAEEAARRDPGSVEISDEDLAALAAQADEIESVSAATAEDDGDGP